VDFAPTDEQRRIRETVAEFVDEEVVARAAEIEETDEFPADLVAEMGEVGLIGMVVAEEYGGAGLDSHAYAMAVIEIARASGGLATSSRHTPPSSVDCSKRRARRPSARRL